MTPTFIEITGVTLAVSDFLTDESYAGRQQLLMKHPDAGEKMPGCSGLRKLRAADFKRGKGSAAAPG